MGVYFKFINKAYDYVLFKDSGETKDNFSDYKLLMQAKAELDSAQNVFSAIDDPEMIDWAVFNLRAAEERYDILIKKMKRHQHI